MLVNNKEYLEISHSNDAVSFKVEEMKMDVSTKSTQDDMNISDKQYLLKYLVPWVTYFFKKGYLNMSQMKTDTYRLPIFMYWRVLSHLSNISTSTCVSAIKYIHKLTDRNAALVTMSYVPVRFVNGSIVNQDYGSLLELGFTFGNDKPNVYIIFYEEHIVFLDENRNEVDEATFLSSIQTGVRTGDVLVDSLVKSINETYVFPNMGKMDAAALKTILNISSTTDLISGTMSIAPIDINTLIIKSNRAKESLKTFLNNKIIIKMHSTGFRSVKNVTYYAASHNAVIEVYSRISGELLDIVYIVDSYVYFQSSFNTSKYDNLLVDETVNSLPVYVGDTVYDHYNDSFYYTIYDKDLSNLNIQKYGSVQFRLTWLFANI